MRDDQRGRLPRARRDRPPPDATVGGADRAGTVGGADQRGKVDPGNQHDWLDQDAGPVVRPYTLTGGRSRPITGGLSLLTHVEALYAPDADLINLQPEHRANLTMTRTALSLAEIAARVDLPVGVVRVLIGDLLHENLVSTFESDTAVNPPDENTLQAVIDGLRAL
jgi:Protein of unknown function (DUF742)